MRRVMIDIETLSTEKNAIVTSIGLYDGKKGDLIDVAIGEQILNGRDLSKSTHEFWMKQPRVLFASQVCRPGHPVDIVTKEVFDFCATADEIWALGVGFDIAILEDLMGVQFPYRKVMCLRTLEAVVRGLVNDPPERVKPELVHDALSDAKAQWRTLQNYLKVLDTPG